MIASGVPFSDYQRKNTLPIFNRNLMMADADLNLNNNHNDLMSLDPIDGRD